MLVIRGTSNGVEWFDDATSIFRQPFQDLNCGTIGDGFAKNYESLEVVEVPSGVTTGAAARSAPRSLRGLGSFSRQVSDLVERHSRAAARTVATPRVIGAGPPLSSRTELYRGWVIDT
jgi:hypothetical protein